MLYGLIKKWQKEIVDQKQLHKYFPYVKAILQCFWRPELMKKILMLQSQTNKMHTEIRDSLVKRNILHYFLLKPVVRHMCVQCRTLGVEMTFADKAHTISRRVVPC